MSGELSSSWNSTDGTFHIGPDDEIELHKQVLRFIFCSTWLGVLCTVALAFLTLSTPHQRRAAIFALQGIGFSLAIIYNICEIVYSIRRFEATFKKSENSGGPSYFYLVRLKLLDLTLEHVVPICCDAAILIKVHSFFPYPVYLRRKQALVLGPLVILMIPRIILTIVASYAIWKMETDVEMVPGQAYPVDMGYKWVPLVQNSNQAEFSLQAFYCLYAATLLLCKAAQFTLGYSNPLSRVSVRRRMRFFLEAMLMTFIPPIAFASASAATIACDSDHYCYFREMSGTLLNTSVLFGLLATTWSSIRARHSPADTDTMVFSSPSQVHGVTLPQSFLTQTFPTKDSSDDYSKRVCVGGSTSPLHFDTTHTHQSQEQRGKVGRTTSGYFDFDGKTGKESEDREDMSASSDINVHIHTGNQLPEHSSGSIQWPNMGRPSQEIVPSPHSGARCIRSSTLRRDGHCPPPASAKSRPTLPSDKKTQEGLHLEHASGTLLQQVWNDCNDDNVSECGTQSGQPQSSAIRPAFFDSSYEDDDGYIFEKRLYNRDGHRRDNSVASCPVHGNAPISASNIHFATPPAAYSGSGHFLQQQQQVVYSDRVTRRKPEMPGKICPRE